ncbi:MAG TPA: hypothetical protein VFY40_19600 [Blastocatellia bacterium]|nr:hypothetical protein [Blastocatellia bacterium]
MFQALSFTAFYRDRKEAAFEAPLYEHIAKLEAEIARIKGQNASTR